MLNKRLMLIGGLILAAAMLVACGTTEQTVITVEVPGGVETIIVEQTVSNEPIPATEQIPCNPLPEGVIPAEEAATGTTLAAPAAPALESAYGEMSLGPAEQGGTTYRAGVFSDITSLNYFAANGPDNTVYNSFMLPGRPTLFDLNELTFELLPDLAAPGTTIPVIDQQEGDLYYADVPLRQDVVWSDGEPFTADDIAWTGNIVIETGLLGGNWQNWYDPSFLDHVEALDDYTVRFYFHTIPGIARWDYGSLGAPILAEHFWAPLVEAADVMGPITALGENPAEEDLVAAQSEAWTRLYAIDVTGEPLMGAFTFTRWEAGAFIEVTANPTYYETGDTFTGTDANGVEYTWEMGPFVDRVVYSIYADQNTAVLALQNNEIDFIISSLGLQRGFQQQIEATPDLEIIRNNTMGFRYLTFNMRRQPMNDCAFRQAAAVLIDREYVTNTVLQRVAFPVYTVVPTGNTAYFNPDVPQIGRGLARADRIAFAVEILQGAGYSWEDDVLPAWDAETATAVEPGRLIMPGGVHIPDLAYWAPNAGYDPLRATFAIHIEQWLREAGIPVTAHLAGFNVLIPRLATTREWDLFTLGWSDSVFPSSLRDGWHSEQDVPDGNNNPGYRNPDYDALADTLLTCTTYEECRDIAFQLQMFLGTELPTIGLFDSGIMEAYRPTAIEFPFYTTLSGWQYIHLGGNDAQAYVRVTGAD